MKIEWTISAEKDITHIKQYIGMDSKFYAEKLVERIFLEVEKLPEFPKIGRIVPEINSEDIREIIFGTYRIVYRILLDKIQIITVIHSSKRLLLK